MASSTQPPLETTYAALEARGFSRRDFLKFCALSAVALGLGPTGAAEIAHALENKPRLPVLWINGLSCSCCTESCLRPAHPLVADSIISLVSLDYQDVIMAPSGAQAEASLQETIEKYRGNYLLAVEGNAPLGEQGMYCIDGGKPFLEKLKHCAAGAKAIVAWGTCASWGCVHAAHPNPTDAKPVHQLIHNKPIIKVPGCPAIPDIMSGIVTYMLTYERMPELDAQGRPLMFYGKRVHDQCYRRAHFDAGEYVERWDDDAARLGLCLYKMGCKGPTTYNACPATRWNDGVSFPIQSGHGCLGCSEQGFWDQGSFYDRITTLAHFGTNLTAEKVGVGVIAAVGAGVAVHAGISTAVHLKKRAQEQVVEEMAQDAARDAARDTAEHAATVPPDAAMCQPGPSSGQPENPSALRDAQ